MSKKKISSQDFLNLMDEQEVAPEKMAFNPKQKTTPRRPTKAKKKSLLFLGKYKLTPIQEEWIQFAVAKTPQFVVDLVSSPAAQKIVSRIVRF